tara:strand:+ start:1378 stop:1599 length:222 start_codon:yes stop_codon:yes gene_type:complete
MIIELFLFVATPLLAWHAHTELGKELPDEDHDPDRPADESGDSTPENDSSESTARPIRKGPVLALAKARTQVR